ncbi:DEAD/DEAH box helicase [uncultured Oscillibacter sp.]|uniref:DEAD/DEAH box helicase n=1 Tax=uncultured Oscillibacter sp. TaxID=876091 RepID=UPI0025D3A05F|nr:DEAD/DEAH box helicase [uncultured Oscillibacter sp.]
MIFSNTSNYMLKYQKAKAKLVEYDIPQKDYPKFPLNSNELSYPVIYILSRYAESVIEDNTTDREEFSPHLVVASQYFDAAVGAKDRTVYDIDFLLSGTAAYFLSDDFGSAKVLCSEFFKRTNPETNAPQKIMGNFLGYLLLNRELHISDDTPTGEKVRRSLLTYYTTGEGLEEIQSLLSEYRKEIYENDAPMEIYYVDILCAVVTVALSRSSWSLLPRYSELDLSLWSDYLKTPKAARMLWPAQQLIGEKGILSGQSAIVQLPTGVGKTKSIELIIRSSFASDRATTAIIVAPLRALCNEIANDMISAFGDEILVNQFSDVLEDDFSLELFLSFKSKILICTPEKLSYIIHHQADFLDEIGLYIFDEGHMFDDGSRGAIYELLISEIRGHILREEQIILLSAVLSNAEQIQKWLLGEAGVLASDPKIKATPKTIGFASKTKDIHYYSDDSTQEDFYVPRSIEVVALQKRPREKKQRYFPELTDAKDIAIYYANKLSKNGGAAIFANRTSTVQTVINRIIELKDRGCDLTEIKRSSDAEEMNRLAKLMSEYYGVQHPYAIACHLGVVPHYSNLPNGLRLAVEHAFRGKALCLVVCTSTLAQGVNIPIKYLFMTSFMVARNSMQIRSFQNLMGRTARSGMYTEGSVIVTDPRLFDNRNNRSNGGNLRWNDCTKMFDSSAAEPCGSSILSLVRDIVVDYQAGFIGSEVAKYIIENYGKNDCFDQLISELSTALLEKYPSKTSNNIAELVSFRKRTIEAIENHLCFVFSNDENTDRQAVASDICKSTLAYFMANDEEKALIEKIFDVIALKINNFDYSRVKNYAKTMVGIDLSLQIEKWLSENRLTQQNYTNEQLVEMLISFFLETHTIKKGTDCFSDICQMWLDGCSFIEMNGRTSLPIADLEDICSKSISYELSFFVGSIIDIIEVNDEDIVNPLPNMLLHQRRMKYGVKTETAVSVCEKVFNDRFLANLLAEEMGHDAIEANSIVGAIKSHKDDILTLLSDYPTYFSERIKWVCKV